MIQVPQNDGSIKLYRVDTSSHKDFGPLPKLPDSAAAGSGASPNSAPNAGSLKKRAKASLGKSSASPSKRAGITDLGAVGGRDTPAVAAAKKKYSDAQGLASFADRAASSHNAQEQREFAMAMARTMAGRFQMQEYDQAVKHAGIANTFQQWLNNISTGALPDKVMANLVQAAKDYASSSRDELNDAQNVGKPSQPGGVSDDDFLLNLGKVK